MTSTEVISLRRRCHPVAFRDATFALNIDIVEIGQIHNATVENSSGKWTDLLLFISVIMAPGSADATL